MRQGDQLDLDLLLGSKSRIDRAEEGVDERESGRGGRDSSCESEKDLRNKVDF